MNSANAAQTLTTFLPLAVIALVLWALAKWGGTQMWVLILVLLLGVILSGTIIGPDIQNLLSQISGGRLH